MPCFCRCQSMCCCRRLTQCSRRAWVLAGHSPRPGPLPGRRMSCWRTRHARSRRCGSSAATARRSPTTWRHSRRGVQPLSTQGAPSWGPSSSASSTRRIKVCRIATPSPIPSPSSHPSLPHPSPSLPPCPSPATAPHLALSRTIPSHPIPTLPHPALYPTPYCPALSRPLSRPGPSCSIQAHPAPSRGAPPHPALSCPTLPRTAL